MPDPKGLEATAGAVEVTVLVAVAVPAAPAVAAVAVSAAPAVAAVAVAAAPAVAAVAVAESDSLTSTRFFGLVSLLP